MTGSKEMFEELRQLEDLEQGETLDPNQPLTTTQLGYLEQLLHSSVYDELQRQEIESRIPDLTIEEASALIEHLQNNQQDKFHQSDSYSLTELYSLVRKIANA